MTDYCGSKSFTNSSPALTNVPGPGAQETDTALAFDGSSTYVQATAFSEIDLDDDFTFSVWAKLESDDTQNNGVTYTLFQNPDSSGNRIGANILNGYLNFGYGISSSSASYVSCRMPDGEWVFISCVHDASDTAYPFKVFLNGDLRSGASVNGSALYAGTHDFVLGRTSVSSHYNYFIGSMDEMRIWDYARTGTEIAASMKNQLTGQESGLVAYWQFENATVNAVQGGAPTLHGTAVNVISPFAVYYQYAWKVAGQVGEQQVETVDNVVHANEWTHVSVVSHQSYALEFDGVNDYIDCGSAEDLDISGDLTLEAFVQMSDLSQPCGILSKGFIRDNSKDASPYTLYVGDDGCVVFAFEDKNQNIHSFSSTVPLVANRFHKIGVVRKQAEVVNNNLSGTYQVDQQGSNEYQVTADEPAPSTIRNQDTITIYIDGQACTGVSNYEGARAGSTQLPLVIGECNGTDGSTYYMNGTISQVRIWEIALDAGDICSEVTPGAEGLIGWWQMEANEGAIAYDSIGQNNGDIFGADWVENPDPAGNTLQLFINGVLQVTVASALPLAGSDQFRIGNFDNQYTPTTGDCPNKYFFFGQMDEIRIWNSARNLEQIQDNIFTRLTDLGSDLVAYYQCDQSQSTADLADQYNTANGTSVEASQLLADSSGNGYHLLLGGSETTGSGQDPVWFISTAPVGYETPQAINVLTGLATTFSDRLQSAVSIQEYGDLQYDTQGMMTGALKKCYAYIKGGIWNLITGFKTGDLYTEWVGQAQFQPQLIGYIEGAPPVPSENFTGTSFTVADLEDYNGGTSVEIVEAETLNYSYSKSTEQGVDTSLESSLGTTLGGFDLDAIVAPMGIGVSTDIGEGGTEIAFNTSFESSNSWLSESSVSQGRSTNRNGSAQLSGNWQSPDGPDLYDCGRRFIPDNLGFALVQSDTADIFALRLKSNNALVSYTVRPNPDIPKDWNLISFPINPTYTKQGTLDGRVGFQSSGAVQCDSSYPDAANYGEYSYFKPSQAYQLQATTAYDAETA
ncbi:MAG: LamG domain-containing protein, partial [Gammaproteobacteria bacterium]|nr:LamG domain-containing protein [Gammaproteobacteria bacterium]